MEMSMAMSGIVEAESPLSRLTTSASAWLVATRVAWAPVMVTPAGATLERGWSDQAQPLVTWDVFSR
jgi:hypothetical protein